MLKKLVQSAETSMKNSGLPIAITDAKLKCCWANQEAISKLPTLALPDGVVDLFVKDSLDPIRQKIISGAPFFCELQNEPLNSIQASFIPLCSKNAPYACLVIFSSGIGEAVSQTNTESERIVTAFTNEFRMPLTIVFSTLGLMSRRLENEGDQTMKDYLRLITHNCYRMLRLSNNVADITRYRSGIGGLKCRNGDFNQFLSGLCSAAAVLTSTVNIPLEFKIPQKGLFMSFDPAKLATAFLNLISNCCKYTRDGNIIRVKADTLDKQVVVTISDSGRGIRPEYLQSIFQPYFANSSGDPNTGGVGLGLTLVKYIIAQHGGTVAVRSEYGKGTTVAFTLPVRMDGALPDYVSENSADYLADRFSPIYIELSDVCRGPMP